MICRIMAEMVITKVTIISSFPPDGNFPVCDKQAGDLRLTRTTPRLGCGRIRDPKWSQSQTPIRSKPSLLLKCDETENFRTEMG